MLDRIYWYFCNQAVGLGHQAKSYELSHSEKLPLDSLYGTHHDLQKMLDLCLVLTSKDKVREDQRIGYSFTHLQFR